MTYVLLVFFIGALDTELPPPFFLSFCFTYLFSIKFLYFIIISSLFPYFNMFVSIFIQCYVKNNLHVSILYILIIQEGNPVLMVFVCFCLSVFHVFYHYIVNIYHFFFQGTICDNKCSCNCCCHPNINCTC